MHVYSSQLLLPYKHPHAPDWENHDSHELFQKNLQQQPQSWPWRNRRIRYTWNSNGYRCAEWANIDWSQSHVLMGCSYVMGLGVDDDDVITAGVKGGVNLGQCGTNVYTIQYNSLRLIDAGHRPLSVKIIIPDLARNVYWGSIDWRDLTPHDFVIRGDGLVAEVRQYYQSLLAIEPMAEQMSYMTMRTTQALWHSVGVSCDLYHHWLPQNPKFIMASILPKPVDNARDFSGDYAHPGPATLDIWRSIMYADSEKTPVHN